MNTEVLKDSNAAIWRPLGDELEDINNIQGAITELKSSGIKAVILSLLEKEWISSSEIGTVMWAYKELESLNAGLCLVVDSPFILKTIKLTGIDQLLPIFDTQENAIKHLEDK